MGPELKIANTLTLQQKKCLFIFLPLNIILQL